MDDALRRTLSGSLYRVKGYMLVPFDLELKAIDEDDAEELALKKLDAEDNVKVEIEEVIEEDE